MRERSTPTPPARSPMRLRAAVAASLAACLPCVPSAATAVVPKPQIVDPAGDQMVLGPSYDVRSALFSSAGMTVRSGKKTTYVPTKLVVTVTYSAAVPSELYAAQIVAFQTDECRVY